jgi:hypothetical protein
LIDPGKIPRSHRDKTDKNDSQWIQRLHTFGLLTPAFRPADAVLPLRSYLRQRAALLTVFSGQAGGWPKRFGDMVKGETRGFAIAPILVEIAPDLSKWTAEIPAQNIMAAAEALFPGTMIWNECETGQELAEFDKTEDGASCRYAVINLGAPDRDSLERRFEIVREAVPFRFTPL